MKPDYKNWIPKWMITGLIGASALLFAGTLVFAVTGLVENVTLRLLLTTVLGIAFIISKSTGVTHVAAA